MTDAALPYNGTEGHSGSETSRDRAVAEAVNGVASVRQRFVLINAGRAGEKGITVAELRDSKLHHGRISGSLSSLHKVGRLARLTETRDKCKVYVLPEYVRGRPTEPFGRRQRKASGEVTDAAKRVEAFMDGLKGPFSDDMLFDVERSIEPDDIRILASYALGRIE